MKALTLALLLCATLPSLAQQFFTIKAGPVYSPLDGVDSDFALGYHFGIGVQERLTDVLGFGFDINFLNQRAAVEDISVAARSINAMLCYQFYASDRFFFMAGLESGIVSSYRVEDETSSGELEYRFGYALGMTYGLADRWDIYARYVGPFDHKQGGFDFNVQLGTSYKIRMR